MKNYQVYVFDLDGTITDTATVWLGIFRDCLTKSGVIPPDDITLSKHTHDWRQVLGLGVPAEKLEAFIAHAHTLAKERLQEAPLHTNALETLEALKSNGKQVAIFSAMDRPIFELAMKHQNLYDIVEVAVAGTDVPNLKPKPDGILKALDDLGISKKDYNQVAYIGDKDTDIQAAHNAGVDAILYYPAAHHLVYNLSELEQHKPDHVVTVWDELLEATFLNKA